MCYDDALHKFTFDLLLLSYLLTGSMGSFNSLWDKVISNQAVDVPNIDNYSDGPHVQRTIVTFALQYFGCYKLNISTTFANTACI